jgi:hypothetical protein
MSVSKHPLLSKMLREGNQPARPSIFNKATDQAQAECETRLERLTMELVTAMGQVLIDHHGFNQDRAGLVVEQLLERLNRNRLANEKERLAQQRQKVEEAKTRKGKNG